MGKMILWGILILFSVLTISLVLGPKVEFKKINTKPIQLHWAITDIDSILQSKESLVTHLKEDNEARVIWADSIPQKTPYSIVYIHGFSASQAEGDPVHRSLAKAIGANLFLSRLQGHGLSTKEAFKDITPQDWINDTKEALAIGRLIGEKVIVVSCSTGGTLSIALAPQDPSIHSLVLLSPNIEVAIPGLSLVTGPWGEEIIQNIVGEYRMGDSTKVNKYWSDSYHTDGLLALQGLIDQTMTPKAFSKIDIPIYLGYYYKNKVEQDHVVSVPAMLEFYDQVKTPANLKKKTAFANAGNHVISSKHKNENWKDVHDDILAYLTPIL